VQITTPRLHLYEWDTSHAQVLFDLNSDPEVIRYTGDPPFESVDEARRLIENYDQYRKYGHGRWLCELKDTGEVVGWCGLKKDKEKENENEFIDLGYRFFRKHWGKGFATEAAYASLAYGFEKLQMKEIIARAVSENEASIKVMQKLGMTYWKGGDCHSLPAHYYRIGGEEFEGVNPPGLSKSDIHFLS
jgi:ribosomal-protein-alanine N-acetyltransferase